MPGDKIIREGERGHEMYFIQEGVCEVVIKKNLRTATKSTESTSTSTIKYDKIFLEKGSYFGEVIVFLLLLTKIDCFTF